MAGCAYRFTQRHPDHTSYKKYKDVFDERRRITCLTSFNLLTLGIVQASLALLSLNRKFQDLSAEKIKRGSQ